MATTNYKDKVVVITGAASGMGRTLAVRFGADGAKLALCDVQDKELEKTGEMAKAAGAAQIELKHLDVSNRDEIFTWASEVREQLGDASVVINNAGIAYIADFETQDLEYLERVMAVNFFAVVWGARAFLPQLRVTGGSLANTSSVFGMVGATNNSAYCAAKFAVRGLNEVLWQEMSDTGVHVASIHPGGIKTQVAANARVDTGSNQDLQEAFEELAPTTAERAAEIIYKGIKKRKKRILVGRDAHMLAWLLRLLPVNYSGIMGLTSGGSEAND